MCLSRKFLASILRQGRIFYGFFFVWIFWFLCVEVCIWCWLVKPFAARDHCAFLTSQRFCVHVLCACMCAYACVCVCVWLATPAFLYRWSIFRFPEIYIHTADCYSLHIFFYFEFICYVIRQTQNRGIMKRSGGTIFYL